MKMGISNEQRRRLKRLAAAPEDEIDTSDIPEVLDWSGAVRGGSHRLNEQSDILPAKSNGQRLGSDELKRAPSSVPYSGSDNQPTHARRKRHYVTLSLEIVKILDEKVRRPGESRSAAIARLLENEARRLNATRVDLDVISWFREHTADDLACRSEINRVLRQHVDHEQSVTR